MKGAIVLIPAHNEGRNIAAVVAAARPHLPVLVVDDGSTDDTANLAEAAGAEVIRQIPNQGKGRALLAGIRRSLENGCPAVITLDGDGQHDAAEIPAFLSAWHQHPSGLIIGKRNFSSMPFIRRLANTLGGALFSLAVGHPVADNQSGYRLISRELMALMLDDDEPGFELEVDMIVIALKHQLGISWVPIKTIYTGGASHIKPFQHFISFFRICWKAHKTMHHEELTPTK